MSDTATESTKRVQKPRDVDYTLEIVDDLPDLDVQRRSPLTDQINKIINDDQSHGHFVRIASYANGSAASAAANQLRKKHGDSEAVEGWTFRPRRSDRPNPDTGELEPRTGLFARYNPSAVVEGARAAFDQKLKDREVRNAERRAAREAEGNGEAPKGRGRKS